MIKLSQQEIDKIIFNVEATLAIEGLKASKDSTEWIEQYLQGKLTGDEVRELIKKKYGVNKSK